MDVTISNESQSLVRTQAIQIFKGCFTEDVLASIKLEGKNNHQWTVTFFDETRVFTKSKMMLFMAHLSDHSGVRGAEVMANRSKAAKLINTALPEGINPYSTGSEDGIDGAASTVDISPETETSSSEQDTDMAEETNTTEENTEENLDLDLGDLEADESDVSSLETEDDGVDAEGPRVTTTDVNEDGELVEVDGDGNETEDSKASREKDAEKKAAKEAEREAKRKAKEEEKARVKAEKEEAKRLQKEADEANAAAEEAKEQAKAEGMRGDIREAMIEYGQAQTLGVSSAFYEGAALDKLESLTQELNRTTAARLQQEEYDKLFGTDGMGNTKFPNRSVRSNRRATYRSWVIRGGLAIDEMVTHEAFVNPQTNEMQPMSLGSTRSYTSMLYLNDYVNEETVRPLLALVNRYPYTIIARIAKYIDTDILSDQMEKWQDMTPDEIKAWADQMDTQHSEPKPEPKFKSLKLKTAIANDFMNRTFPNIARILGEVLGRREGVTDEVEGANASVSEVFTIVNGIAGFVSEEWIQNYVKHQYNLLSEEDLNTWREGTDQSVLDISSLSVIDDEDDGQADDEPDDVSGLETTEETEDAGVEEVNEVDDGDDVDPSDLEIDDDPEDE